MSDDAKENEPGKLAFTVGILGNMDIEESVELVAQVRAALLFLMQGKEETDFPYEQLGLEEWGGLGGTEIVVLCNMAPGADTIGARAAEELKARELPVRLRCPLPFPAEVYPQASTFKTEEERTRFEWTLRSLPSEEVFPVLLREHPITKAEENKLPWWDDAAKERWKSDLDDKAVTADGTKVRHLRYRAAGEYVAIYCDVLIVLWDDREKDNPSDTARAVNAKRRGLEDTLLPVTAGFTWADNGPVLHLAVSRKKFSGSGAHPHAGRWRILHPHELDPGPAPHQLAEGGRLPKPEQRPAQFLKHFSYDWDPGEHGEQLALWREQGNSAFITAGWNLRCFTELAKGTGPGARIQLAPWRDKVAENSRREVDNWKVTEDEKYARPRAAMARARRMAADMANALDNRRQEALKALFRSTVLSALMIHTFAHYHPHVEAGDHGAPEPAWPVLVRVALLLGAIVTAAVSLNRFAKYHASRGEARRYDIRALSEGLRVQLAWALAGIHRSAAANYMQRQRGELTWVRNAMSSLSIPYHQWVESWLEADDAEKLKRLNKVKEKWVTEQSNYFFKGQLKRESAMHFWHTLGKLMALAGALLFAITGLLFFASKPFDQTWIKETLIWVGIVASLGIVTRFHQCWAALSDGWIGIGPQARDRLRPKWLMPWKGVKADGAASLEHALVERLLGPWQYTEEHAQHPPRHGAVLDENKSIAAGRKGFGRLLFFACWPAFALFLVAWGLCHWHTMPQLKDTCIIFAASTSVAGALMVAWAEKQLYSEESYHFNSMGSIFRAAEERLSFLLQPLGEAATDAKAKKRAISEAQELLLALGKEALNENAEWLILHRSRPMEPILGG